MEHVELSIGKMNIPLRKEFPLALPPINKIVTLVFPSTFADILSVKEYVCRGEKNMKPNMLVRVATEEHREWTMQS